MAAQANGHARRARVTEKPEGNACVLAMGTDQPSNVMDQSTFADYYFRVTNSEHMTELKGTLSRICAKSQIKQRHLLLTEDMLKQHPCLATYDEPSLSLRQQIMVPAVLQQAKAAAEKALREWGQPASAVTHVIFCATAAVRMPGPQYELARMLGLSPHVEGVALHYAGCQAGGTVLRLAKAFAESRRGARVLAICSEITAGVFRGPSSDGSHVDNLMGSALLGDGGVALVIGADPDNAAGEHAWYEMLWAGQAVLPDTAEVIRGYVTEAGLMLHLQKSVIKAITDNIEAALRRAFGQFGVSDWNSVFWAPHAGGAGILDSIENVLGLDSKKLRVTRQVLADNGNMASATVLFTLYELRKWSVDNCCSTTGEGCDLGVLFGFGPGLGVETIVLKSVLLPLP